MAVIQDLQIGSIFLIFVVSLCGFLAPVLVYDYQRRIQSAMKQYVEHPMFLLIKSLSAGIILGVALMHLLPDGQEDLEAIYDYPVSLAMVIAGIILTLCLEQAMSAWGGDHHHGHLLEQPTAVNQSRIQANNQNPVSTCTLGHDHVHEHGHDHDHGHSHDADHDHIALTTLPSRNQQSSNSCDEHCGIRKCPHVENNASSNVYLDHDHNQATHAPGSIPLSFESKDVETGNNVSQQGNAWTNYPTKDDITESQRRALIKTVVLEVSVAVHSIIVGFGFGLLESVGAIKILMVALSLHQLFEGISLGTAISESALTRKVVGTFGLIFALTMPIGIIIGMETSSSDTGDQVKGFANCLAAGSLVYSSLVEMVAEAFFSQQLATNRHLRFGMVASFSLGCGLMAVLAIYA